MLLISCLICSASFRFPCQPNAHFKKEHPRKMSWQFDWSCQFQDLTKFVCFACKSIHRTCTLLRQRRHQFHNGKTKEVRILNEESTVEEYFFNLYCRGSQQVTNKKPGSTFPFFEFTFHGWDLEWSKFWPIFISPLHLSSGRNEEVHQFWVKWSLPQIGRHANFVYQK